MNVGDGEGNDGLLVKVMSDEQMDILRKQISVYATISQQLLQMHKNFSAQLYPPGMGLGNPYLDPVVACGGGQKITTRQRWSPTPAQLQILEHVFDECRGTPGKQKIQDMTTELAKHGQISETNVYNWFQNRRARMKRKQPPEPEKLKKTDAETTSIHSSENSSARTENIYYVQTPDIGIEKMVGAMFVPESFSPYLQSEPYDML